METSASTHGSDVLRQVSVVVATLLMLACAVVGTGLLGGTPVHELQNGALDADGSALAPARPAFSIWSLIYVLSIAYAIWQALPGQRADVRQRALGWWLVVIALLNGLWLVTAQFATLPLTVVAIILLLVALGIAFRRTEVVRSRGLADAILIDGTIGVHLGWVSLATVANVAAWLTASDLSFASPDVWAIAIITIVAVIGIATQLSSHAGRVAPGLAMAWGLAWIAVARLTGEPRNVTIAIAAAAAGILIVVATIVTRVSRTRTPGRTRAAAARVR